MMRHKNYLIAVNVEVCEIAVAGESSPQLDIPNLLSHILDVAKSTLVLGLGNHRLRPVLPLRIAAGGLPLVSRRRRFLGRGRGGGRRGFGSLRGGSSCGLGGSSGGRGPSLSRSRRRSGLGQGNGGSRAGGSGETTSPSQGLSRDGLFGLGGGRRCRRGRCLSARDSRSRSRLLRLLGGLFIGGLFRDALLVSGRLGSLELWGDFRLGSLNRGLLGNSLSSGLSLGNLLQLLIYTLGLEGGGSLISLFLRLLSLGGLLGSSLNNSRNLSDSGGLLFSGLWLLGGLGNLLVLVINVPPDIIQDEVSRGLLGKNEGLNEFPGFLRLLVGSLTDDLDEDSVLGGGERVDVGNADLALLEIELLNSLLDGLRS